MASNEAILQYGQLKRYDSLIKKYIDVESSTTIAKDITNQDLNLDTLNMAKNPGEKMEYICLSELGSANIYNKPMYLDSDGNKLYRNTAFRLKSENIKWESEKKYMTTQTYTDQWNNVFTRHTIDAINSESPKRYAYVASQSDGLSVTINDESKLLSSIPVTPDNESSNIIIIFKMMIIDEGSGSYSYIWNLLAKNLSDESGFTLRDVNPESFGISIELLKDIDSFSPLETYVAINVINEEEVEDKYDITLNSQSDGIDVVINNRSLFLSEILKEMTDHESTGTIAIASFRMNFEPTDGSSYYFKLSVEIEYPFDKKVHQKNNAYPESCGIYIEFLKDNSSFSTTEPITFTYTVRKNSDWTDWKQEFTTDSASILYDSKNHCINFNFT